MASSYPVIILMFVWVRRTATSVTCGESIISSDSGRAGVEESRFIDVVADLLAPRRDARGIFTIVDLVEVGARDRFPTYTVR